MSAIKHTFVSILSIVALSTLAVGCAGEAEDDELLETTTALNKKKADKPTPPPAPPVEAGVIPQDCLGYFEREPNDTKPDHFRGRMMCGETSPGDLDKFEFDINDDAGAYTIVLDAPAGAYLQLRSSCTPTQTVWGTAAQLRVNPRKDCTLHVNITSETKQIYRLHKVK